MRNWKRITLVIFVLIGSTASFAYWSLNQFDKVFDDLSAIYLASTLTTYPPFTRDADLASTSLAISGELATSTPTSEVGAPTEGVGADPELSFTFPQKGTKVYIGCTYPISWQSSTMVNSLVTTLVDANTKETMGPIASGLAKENTTETGSQNLKWKVGAVWPGAYYIKVSKINGVEAEFRSEVFEINKMSKNVSASEKENFCKKSGGSF